MGITAGDVADTISDFLPFVGSFKDIYQGFRDGNGWQAAAGIGGLVLDVATLGTSSLVKGVIKTGIKQGVKTISKNVAKRTLRNACFVAGTFVKTAEGEKMIETIKEGDEVWSYNETTKKNELRKVVRTFVREKEIVYVLTIDTTIIETTDEHPFYVNNKWIPAKNLKVDDIVTLISGEKLAIGTIEIVEKKTKVYNFEVEGLHNYYVSNLGVLVHNTCSKNALIGVRSALAERIGKRGFNQVGFQFQKHSGRGNTAWLKHIPNGAKLNPATYNEAGYKTFKEIWKAPGEFIDTGKFWEKRLSDGRGIRFQHNWNFKGFVD